MSDLKCFPSQIKQKQCKRRVVILRKSFLPEQKAVCPFASREILCFKSVTTQCHYRNHREKRGQTWGALLNERNYSELSNM